MGRMPWRSYIWVILACCIGVAASIEMPASKAGTEARRDAGVSSPLRLVSGKRYLVDANSHPFFLNGDAAWSLIGQLTREEADLYLEDRRSRGFNTILMSLLEHPFSTNAPGNAYGGPGIYPVYLVARVAGQSRRYEYDGTL
jgi:hypothetical protein